jgi:hypothetical protein
MSQNDKKQSISVHVGADETIALEEDVVTTSTSRNDGLEPTLPTGEAIDGKNTLMSFEHRRTDVQGTPDFLFAEERSHAHPSDRHPTLPSGELINSKNTLQSFDNFGLDNHATSTGPPIEIAADGHKRHTESLSPMVASTTNVEPPSTAIAVPIETDHNIVYAELAPELVPSVNVATIYDINNARDAPPTSWYKRRSTRCLLAVVALLVALGLGLSFGITASSDSSDVNLSMSPSMDNNPSLAPSMDPGLTMRVSVLTSFIKNISLLSSEAIMLDGTSPESRALSWIIFNDTTVDTSALASNSSDELFQSAIGFRVIQRYCLLVMWFQQTESAKWSITTGWLVDPEECTWFGIACESVESAEGAYDAVTQIVFNLIGSYVGSIPPDIGLLSNLRHFEIKNTLDIGNGNQRFLQGSLPASIGQWTALTYFDVSGNALTGTFPASIGQWTALTLFAVSVNSLTGTLPASIGQWTALTLFDATENVLTGTLPASIGQWTALTLFDATENVLTGTLPVNIGQWTALTYFAVSGNKLTGTLPSSIAQWTALSFFDVTKNYFANGTSLPVCLCN